LSALIVDDEPIARARIELLLKRDPQVRIVGSCASVAQWEELDASIVPDLVFLDVRMPQRDGFELLETFRARGICPFVIFVTAYSEHAVDAYDAGALDYLLKPFDDVRFAKALGRAKAALSVRRVASDILLEDVASEVSTSRGGPDRLLVSEDGRISLIRKRDIELIQVIGKHVKIYVRGHCYLTRQSLQSVESRLDERSFVRVNRSTIINVDQIVALHPRTHSDSEVVLKRGTRVILSRRYRSRLMPFLVKSCGLNEI
jgi:two-component system LytT family response regulator